MKNLLMLLTFVLSFPIIGFSQNVSSEKETKYGALISKSGTIFTSQTYNLGTVQLPSAYVETLKQSMSFSVVKIINGASSATFLRISHVGYNESSLAMIESSDVKGLFKAVNDIKKLKDKPTPEGAVVEHTYMGADGVTVSLSDDIWKIQLEKYTHDSVDTKEIDMFINKLQEAITKMDSIK